MALDLERRQAASELLERECRRLARDDPHAAETDLSATLRVLTDLLEFFDSHRDERPVDWRPLVRHRIHDLEFVDEGGDTISDARYRVSSEQQEQLVSTVLERFDEQAAEVECAMAGRTGG